MLNISNLRELFSLSQPAKQPNRPRRAFRPIALLNKSNIMDFAEGSFHLAILEKTFLTEIVFEFWR